MSVIFSRFLMFAPKAGKQGTKGDKLIYEDNISTIAFYQKWCLVSTVVSVVAIVVPIFTWTLWDYFWCVFLIVCNFGAWYFMKYIGKPTLNPDGSLVHPGLGFQHVLFKKLIFLTFQVP